jgi:hypothetical protein
MSIEASSTASSTKAVAGTAGHGCKAKAATGDEADALAGAGFLALLTSFEPVADPGEAAVTQLPKEEKLQLAELPLDPFLGLVPQPVPNDLTLLLAQASEVAVDRSGIFGDQHPVGAKAGIRLTGTASGTDKPEVPAAASPLLATETPGDGKRNIDALLEQTAQGLQARMQKNKGAELRSAANAVLAETRALHQISIADVAAREPALSGAMLATGLGDGLLRPGDRVTAKSSLSAAGSGIEGIWGQPTFQPGSRVDTSSAVADPSMLSMESMVADKVSYWVTQGIQNAELKLDGFGGETVEVSISLKGSEAHIDFRTDQPEIRQILEGAVTHLKDLLKNEGLLLSGVSVGTSGQDGAGQQERRNRPGARQAAITTTEAGSTQSLQSLQRISQAAGRAVDLFV